jgi:predicted GNAT family N-acyltransferase
VFQEEQGVASELDEDGDDPKCVHVVAETGDGTPVGTSRMKGNQLGRLSVVRDARNQGLGFLLVASMLRIAFVKKYDLVWANAQPGALGLARIFGFEIDPELLILAGRPHHRVVKDLASHY